MHIKGTTSCEVIHAPNYQGSWVAIGRSVVYYAMAAHAFSAEIECRHCNLDLEPDTLVIYYEQISNLDTSTLGLDIF